VGLPYAKKQLTSLRIRENSILVFEFYLCHEVLFPGIAMYLLDLGYNVDIINHCTNSQLKNVSLDNFSTCRINQEKLKVYNFNKPTIKLFLNKSMYLNYTNIIINTYDNNLSKILDLNFFEIKPVCMVHRYEFLINDSYAKTNKIITLVKTNFYDRNPPYIVNAHYFGEISLHEKRDVSKFIIIGSCNDSEKTRRNIHLLFAACDYLYQKNITKFEIHLIGKNNILPQDKYLKNLKFRGHCSYERMYDEIEESDFILTLIDEASIRYTNAASSSFLLSYGFLKPCIINKKFCEIAGFNNQNAVVYENNKDLGKAMETAINMSKTNYSQMLEHLSALEKEIYNSSLNNLKEALESPLKFIM
jgi:hypothetical protein